MFDLNLKILGSSSAGNSYFIKVPSGQILMIECGMRKKEIIKALDFELSNVIGCLISHEHKDHSKAAIELMKAGIDIYTSKGTIESINTNSHRAHAVQTQQFELGEFTILPFMTEHDAVEPLGFLIYHPSFGKLLFATDTYYIKYKFKGLSYIMVECNYSKKILDENIESGKLEPFLRRRLLASHFSLENVIKFLKANDLSKVKKIMLMHLSNGNSNAAEFKDTVQKEVGIPVDILDK